LSFQRYSVIVTISFVCRGASNAFLTISGLNVRQS
jgi:hypothetical protein